MDGSGRGGRAALPRGRASRERITFSTGSLLKDSEKRAAARTRPTPGLPTGPAAPYTGRVAKATGSPRHLPEQAAKFLMDGADADTDTGASLLSGASLKWPRESEADGSQGLTATAQLQASVFPSVNREAPS